MPKWLSMGVFAMATAWSAAGAPSPADAQSSSSAARSTEGVAASAAPPDPTVTLESKLCYEAGHMMYVNPPSLAKMKRDIDAFIDATVRH